MLLTTGAYNWLDVMQVRTSPVKVSLLPLQDLKVPVPKVKEIRCMEMSMRCGMILQFTVLMVGLCG